MGFPASSKPVATPTPLRHDVSPTDRAASRAISLDVNDLKTLLPSVTATGALRPKDPVTMRTQRTIRQFVDHYIHYLLQTGHRFEQVITTHGQLDYFTEWADRRHVVDIDQLQYALATDYCDHLQGEL